MAEEMRYALEELQVAAEELQQQNDLLMLTQQGEAATVARYTALCDLLADGYLCTTAAGVIQVANRAAAALVAVPHTALAGKPLRLYIARADRRAFSTLLARLRQELLRSAPAVRGAACKRPKAARASPGSARCAMRSSAVITFSPNLGGCFGVVTGQPAAPWRRLKWPPVSSCFVRVLSHSP